MVSLVCLTIERSGLPTLVINSTLEVFFLKNIQGVLWRALLETLLVAGFFSDPQDRDFGPTGRGDRRPEAHRLFRLDGCRHCRNSIFIVASPLT